MARLEIVSQVIAISNLNSLDADCRIRLEKLFQKRLRKVIDSWVKRLVAAAIKQSTTDS
jgi:hypothetical protein